MGNQALRVVSSKILTFLVVSDEGVKSDSACSYDPSPNYATTQSRRE